MATLTIRLDDKLKNDAYAELEKLDVTPSEAIRLTFQYIIENKRLPVKNITISDSEADLIEIVKRRLNNPQKGIKVNLDDL